MTLWFSGRSVRAAWSAAVAIAASALALALAAPPQAAAADRLVTFAARWCERYEDISANRARNDIQESLRDLGRDTGYAAGEAIQPAKELTGQLSCQPLPDWRFTLGTAYASRASSGPWGALTVLTRAFDTEIVTRTSTPLLDVAGRETGASLAGAVTIRLTDEQAALAAVGSRLWLQGGTSDDPVLDRRFPAQYGFGALRCAIDNLNGDNVEWIAFPTGARHVFCYAYYVRPPPTSGTIVVRKVVDDPAATTPNDFRFEGNVSYTSDRSFTLTASAGRDDAATFHRAATGPGDDPWVVREPPHDGWALTSLTCASSTGASVAATDLAAGTASIRLGAGDVVTCTYVNRLAPPVSGLELAKRTLGAVGAFGVTITGAGVDERRTLQTTAEDDPVSTGAIELPAGTYAIDERAPAPERGGRWLLDDVVCDGRSQGRTLPLTLALSPGVGSYCELVNRFEPAGSITLRKRTAGGTAGVGFVVFRDGDTSFRRELTATTREPETTVLATGEQTDELPLGRYTIVETGPRPDPRGEWSVDAVHCDGVPVPSGRGRIEVELTADRPDVDCTYTDRFRPVPEPPVSQPEPPESEPTPEPQPRGGVRGLVRANRPRADLRVTKRAVAPTATVGSVIRYAIVIVNRGPHTARNITAAEAGLPIRDVVSVRSSRGRCETTRGRIVCRAVSLASGRRIVVRVAVRARRPGRLVNRVAISTGADEPRLRDNRARATVTIRRPAAAPRYTG